MVPVSGQRSTKPKSDTTGLWAQLVAPRGSLGLILVALAAGLATATCAGEEPDTAGFEYFEKHIRPVLVTQCAECHSSSSKPLQAGLLVDSRAGLLRGGDSGPSVVPGKPDESLLISALKYDSFEMPPKQQLDAKTIAHFEAWIRMGAPDPRTEASNSPTTVPEIDWSQARGFWSFQPPTTHEPPDHQLAGFGHNRIDAFVAARMQQHGLTPAAPADRATLIRRVTFDLIGLPPTPAEVDSFVRDESPRAYENLVTRLLASPHYGERWTRPWLDLSRYAEDQAHIVGNNKSLFYPNAYLYRDWVINALNQDLPYDEFVRRQLAADLMEPVEGSQIAALGFMGLGPKYYRRNDPEVMADEWEDRVDTLTRGLQGLTVACARCHDHKYDPIETEDYYGLAGVFASTEMFNRPIPQQAPGPAAENTEQKDEQKKKSDKDQAPQQTMHIVRDAKPQNLNVFIRGDVRNKGPEVPRRYLQILTTESPEIYSEGSGRRQLAEAIASPDNPLTARVIVNRIWAQYFARGIVNTPSNFGALGERPTHPELLDDLAVRFMESGWSLKWLHREIVLSDTYRQSSHTTPAKLQSDPDNIWLSRMPRRRLSIEAWRDAALSVAGILTDSVGGQSIDVSDPSQTRRTIYSSVSRFDLNEMLARFDFPDPNAHAEQRAETTTPLQKLFVLNSEFSIGISQILAERLTASAADDNDRIDNAYRLLYGRQPTDEERLLGHQFLASSNDTAAGWQQYAQLLLASNEFLYLD